MKKKLINHIQFLRAISVLLVFFYHLKLNYFEYGFIGVDIFFVISGYVISSRIHNEYFEFKEFTPDEFIKYSTIPPFKVYFNIDLNNYKKISKRNKALLATKGILEEFISFFEASKEK